MDKIEKRKINEIDAIIDNMCLMDDDLMSRVFDENTEATQILIGTILQTEVEVVEAKGQWDMKNPLIDSRGIRLDVFAKDSNGNYFDCEVQRRDDGADPRRARFNSSMLDTRMLKTSQKPKELKDSYVIFITENDYFDKSDPIYRINRTLESGETFNDGSHIIYVNGDYKGDDDIGRLISDMKNRATTGFNYKELEDVIILFPNNYRLRLDVNCIRSYFLSKIHAKAFESFLKAD